MKRQDFWQALFSSSFFLPFPSFLFYLLLYSSCSFFIFSSSFFFELKEKKVFYNLFFGSLRNAPKWETWLSFFFISSLCCCVYALHPMASESPLRISTLRSGPWSTWLSDSSCALVIHGALQTVAVWSRKPDGVRGKSSDLTTDFWQN